MSGRLSDGTRRPRHLGAWCWAVVVEEGGTHAGGVVRRAQFLSFTSGSRILLAAKGTNSYCITSQKRPRCNARSESTTGHGCGFNRGRRKGMSGLVMGCAGCHKEAMQGTGGVQRVVGDDHEAVLEDGRGASASVQRQRPYNVGGGGPELVRPAPDHRGRPRSGRCRTCTTSCRPCTSGSGCACSRPRPGRTTCTGLCELRVGACAALVSEGAGTSRPRPCRDEHLQCGSVAVF